MYSLNKYTFAVVYHSDKSSVISLSNHDTMKNAERALEKILEWGKANHEDFEPEHYKIIKLQPPPKLYKK